MIASAGFLFSVFEVILSNVSALLLYGPFLFSGVFYPFYVGYLRGAVDRSCWTESVMQRVRGWVYFGLGIAICTVMAVVVVSRGSALSIFAFLIALFPPIWLAYKLVKWVLIITRASLADTDLFIIRSTISAGFCLPVSCFYLEEYVRLWVYPPEHPWPPYLSVLWMTLVFLVPFVLIEKASAALMISDRPTWLINRFVSAHWLSKVPMYSMAVALVALVSNRAAFRITVMSVLLLGAYLATFGYVSPLISNVVVGFATLFLFISLLMYSMTPKQRIKENVPKTEEELRYALRELVKFDC
jgi:Na+-transporting methylmalonyl-CoA/oxaloacetate decarboxylase gamma subunit